MPRSTNDPVPARASRGSFHFEQGTVMPYRWPRGALKGSRAGLVLLQLMCLLLLAGFFALIVVMVRFRWG